MSKPKRVAYNLVWLEAFSFLWLIGSVILIKMGFVKLGNLGLELSLPLIAFSFFVSGVWGIWKGYILAGSKIWGGAIMLTGKAARIQGFIEVIISLLLMVFPVWNFILTYVK